jgi:hypothetical protein
MALVVALIALVFLTVLPVLAAPNITISSRTPVVNAGNITRNSNIVVQFSESINSGTVSASTFRVHGSISGRISGSYGTMGDTVTFNPTNNFKAGEMVQVTLTTGIHDATDGDGLAAPVTYQFRVASGGTGIYNNTELFIGPSPHMDATAAAVADFNGDGWLDIAIALADVGSSVDLQNKVFFNDGDGTFDSAGYNLGPSDDDSWSLAAGDVDNDGDIDIAVADYADGN